MEFSFKERFLVVFPLVLTACLVALMSAIVITDRGCVENEKERANNCMLACGGPPVVLGTPNSTCYCLREGKKGED